MVNIPNIVGNLNNPWTCWLCSSYRNICTVGHIPTLLILFNMEMNWLINGLVHPLTRPICLWVVCGWHFQSYTSQFSKHLPKVQHESLSLSNTQLSSRPFLQNQLSKTRITMSSTAASHHVGIIQISDPKQLVIDSMQLYPQSMGRGLIKSSATQSPCSSGIGKGCRGPGALVVHNFSLAVIARGDIEFFKFSSHVGPIITIT